MKILLVEDSVQIGRYVKKVLEKSNYKVEWVTDGNDGLWHSLHKDYSVILLDIMLPGMDGLEVLKQIRQAGVSTHVLMLTAMDQVEDRVSGLDAGADDYLAKPFDMRELVARVDSLVRRQFGQKSPNIEVGPLSINVRLKNAFYKGSLLELTPREFALLDLLLRKNGVVVSRSEIEDVLYEDHKEVMSNTVNSSISILRSVLKSHTSEEIILTRRKLGYLVDLK